MKAIKQELILVKQQIEIASRALKLIADNCDVDWRNLTARNALADMQIEKDKSDEGRVRTKRILGFTWRWYRRGSWILSGRDGTHLISWFDRRGENQDARLKITIGRLRVEWW